MAIEGQNFITSETGPPFPIETLLVQEVSGLIVSHTPGVVRVGTDVETLPSGTLVMADDATNYVFVDNCCEIESNTTGYPRHAIPLATVVASSGTIGTITDERTFLANGTPDIDGDSALSDTESTTTSTAFQQKLRLSLSVPTTSEYTVIWKCNLTEDNEGDYAEARVQIDDTTTIDQFQFVPKKKYSAVTASYPSFAGVWRGQLSAGTRNIDLDYRSNDVACLAAIKRARIVAIRG